MLDKHQKGRMVIDFAAKTISFSEMTFQGERPGHIKVFLDQALSQAEGFTPYFYNCALSGDTEFKYSLEDKGTLG